VSNGTGIEDLLRELAPQVLGVVIRRFGDFDSAEDAVQEALLAAARQWPAEGVPENPRGWLATVAARRRIELLRADTARARREQAAAALEPPDPAPALGADDTLTLLMLCCHPALSRPSQVALTLRAVGGLRTAEIGRAFLVPESTIGQRISRAKARIKAEGARFRDPPPEDRPQRLAAVLEVLYLIFNEGYTASEGDALHRVELTAEAIRLTRQLHDEVPRDDPQTGEVAGLLALMLLTDARRPARQDEEGRLVPLAEQDRARWDAAAITEGTALLAATLVAYPIGRYQAQAAIAAVHAEARRAEDTDWPQILALYGVLTALAPGPVVTLNEIVAIAMVDGPQEALARLAGAEPALAGYHRVDAVRAHLLEQAGDRDAARACYRRAAELTLSVPERQYLLARAARC
jgi:RNA polymerase sigma factor (sigma-70 family)